MVWSEQVPSQNESTSLAGWVGLGKGWPYFVNKKKKKIPQSQPTDVVTLSTFFVEYLYILNQYPHADTGHGLLIYFKLT